MRRMRPKAETPQGRWDYVTQRTCRGDHQGGTPLIEICSLSRAVREALAPAVRARYLTACTPRGQKSRQRFLTLQIRRPGGATPRQAKLPGGSRKGGWDPPCVPPLGGEGGPEDHSPRYILFSSLISIGVSCRCSSRISPVSGLRPFFMVLLLPAMV